MTSSSAASPSQLDLVAKAIDLVGERGYAALATVIETWGSAPVPVGGQMVIAAEDEFAGSVSGGCIEGEVIVAGLEVIADGQPRILTFGVANETAWRAGLPCGGRISILVVRIDRTAVAGWLGEMQQARRERRPLAVVTDLASGATTSYRDAGDAPPVVAAALRDGRSTLTRTGEQPETFIHVWLPPPRIVIIGATHIAQVLVEMLRLIGFDALVVDPRTAYATGERFSGVRLIAEWPEDALPALALDPFTALVAVAHTPNIDDLPLQRALEAGCFYVGALGSRRNHAKRVERLAAAGATADQIARIRAPIGLAIGAQGPAEIAAAILAEIIQAVRLRTPS